MRGRQRQGGFTLIELVVSVTILVILAWVAVPSINSAMLGNRLASYANDFVASAQFARSEALKRNAPVILCRSSDGAACAADGDWTQGWIVMCRTNSASSNMCDNPAGAEVLLLQRHPALSTEYHFTADAYSIVFPGSGIGTTQMAATLCRHAPVGNQEREIRITATGRTTVRTERVGTCA
jgi:type IV fimbrial biogenesis protein FimT